MKRRWPITTLLVLAAVALHASFVFYGTDTITTYRNGAISQTIAAKPLFGQVIDMRMLPCAVRDEPASSCPANAITKLQGAFPRWSAPWAVALAGGVVLPFVFLCAAGWLAISGIAGWKRIAAGIGLIVAAFLAAGVTLVVAASSGLSFLFTWNVRAVSALSDFASQGTLVLGNAIALVCLAGGVLLLVKAWRGRKRA